MAKVEDASMMIGEVSRRSGVDVSTIRYYEGVGLLPEPERTAGRHRRYGPSTLDALAFIGQARRLGFEDAEIRELLVLGSGASMSGEDLSKVVSRNRAGIALRMARLAALSAELSRLEDAARLGITATSRIARVLVEGIDASKEPAPNE